MTVAALLLAAGQSRRFGAQDKLLAKLDGVSLVAHAARALSGAGPDLRLAVVSSAPVADVLRQEGFATLMLPSGPQSASIRAGIAELQHQGASRVVIALGDMALLLASDIRALLALPPDQPASAWLKDAPCPPAVFPARWFPRLMALTGDRGSGPARRARELAAAPPRPRAAGAPARPARSRNPETPARRG